MGDGTVKIFLNAKGTLDDVSKVSCSITSSFFIRTYYILLSNTYALPITFSRLDNMIFQIIPDCDEKEYYKNMMKGLIYQSKAIGDGYAWLFYRKNIEAIREHLKHEDNGL